MNATTAPLRASYGSGVPQGVQATTRPVAPPERRAADTSRSKRESYYASLAGLDLTPRELEVLECVSYGLTTRQIAHVLHVGENTVKTHVMRLFAKLGAPNRAALSGTGFQLGLLTARRRPLDAPPPASLPAALALLLPLIALGLQDRQIAPRLGWSEDSVTGRVRRLLRFLGAATRHEAVRLSVEAGYLRLLPNRAWEAS